MRFSKLKSSHFTKSFSVIIVLKLSLKIKFFSLESNDQGIYEDNIYIIVDLKTLLKDLG